MKTKIGHTCFNDFNFFVFNKLSNYRNWGRLFGNHQFKTRVICFSLILGDKLNDTIHRRPINPANTGLVFFEHNRQTEYFVYLRAEPPSLSTFRTNLNLE